MYEAYFTRRLLEELTRAEEATDAKERSIHLRACRYYRDLLQSPEEREAFRHPLSLGGLLHKVSPWPLPVVIADLSTTGFRAQLREPVDTGTLVELQLDGLAPVEAYAAWQDGDEVGFRFVSELHPALLEAALAVAPCIQ